MSAMPALMRTGLVVYMAIVLSCVGCGETASTAPTVTAPPVASVLPSQTTTSTEYPEPAAPLAPSSSTAGAEDLSMPSATDGRAQPAIADPVRSCFTSLAKAMIPVRVFGPTWLPRGAALAEGYWPLVSMPDPPDPGALLPNPRMSGTPEMRSAEILVSVDGGWLLFVENYRGDLGDIAGESIGEVADHPATAYEIGGGRLVQWSADGRWYGVFARGEAVRFVDDVAVNMALLQP